MDMVEVGARRFPERRRRRVVLPAPLARRGGYGQKEISGSHT